MTIDLPAAVCLDLDGTLLDTIPDVFAAVDHCITLFGHRTPDFGVFMDHVSLPINDIFASLLPDGTETPHYEEICGMYESWYGTHSDLLTKPYSGIAELLVFLRDAGVKLGIITNKSGSLSKRLMARFYPEIPFACILGDVPGAAPKPAPDLGVLAAERMGIPAENSAYLGDTPSDMRFARAAGFLPLGAAWGYGSSDEVKAAGAAFLAETPEEIRTLLSPTE